jgi:DNA processing protein
MPATTTREQTLLYNIALTMIPNIGSMLAQNLVAYCGSAEAVFHASKGKLLKVPLVGEDRANAILSADVMKEAEAEMKFIADYNIKALLYSDADYPSRLRECADMPFMLYYKGNADLNADKIAGVVGTRNITEYGREVTRKLIEDISAQDILIVSGLAYGVDIAAHNAALDNKLKTVGVMAHGLNQVYPPQHKPTARKMAEHGGLLTEFHSQVEMHPSFFPQRNRIVAGLCDAVIVIESAVKGGALITANIANSYNKDVFAIPGRIGDKYSSGCNFLIKTFKATMIESGANFLEAMNWQGAASPKKKKAQLSLTLTGEEQKIYQLLTENNELEIDRIVSLSAMHSGEIAATLLEMEMSGVVVSLPGKRYKLINNV